MIKFLLSICLLFSICQNVIGQKDRSQDSNKLGKALEYFSGEKYHEALILLTDLNKRYKLNPRFKAYMAVCLYHEWDYENAGKLFDEIIDDIEIYSPDERCIYYLSAAESKFKIEKYEEAIPLYEKMLTVCHDNEKGDALYRLGFCHMFKKNWQNAADYFISATKYYEKYVTHESRTRIAQMEKMIKGCIYENEIINGSNTQDTITTNGEIKNNN